jgi:hypothetical protein
MTWLPSTGDRAAVGNWPFSKGPVSMLRNQHQSQGTSGRPSGALGRARSVGVEADLRSFTPMTCSWDIVMIHSYDFILGKNLRSLAIGRVEHPSSCGSISMYMRLCQHKKYLILILRTVRTSLKRNGDSTGRNLTVVNTYRKSPSKEFGIAGNRVGQGLCQSSWEPQYHVLFPTLSLDSASLCW